MKRIALITLSCLALLACSEDKAESDQQKAGVEALQQLTVYKTPSCGCCGDWVDHVQQNGFATDVVDQQSVAHIKDRFGIPAHARSCHTAVTDDGLVFEGHVPAKFAKDFLASRPANAKGLIVPAMPLGSPGMEYQDQFNPYTVYQLNNDGTLSEWASVASYEEQF